MRITKEREERKKEILEVSRKMILERGYHNTSVEDIVKSINVAKGLFYYYFPKKSSLIQALSDELVEDVRMRLDETVSDEKLSYGEKLNRILIIYFNKINENNYLVPLYESHISNGAAHLESKLKALATQYVLKILENNKDFITKTEYPEYLVKVLIGGFSDLYRDGVRDPEVYRCLIGELMGIDI